MNENRIINKHPSFGKIVVTKPQAAGGVYLFGSEARHQSFVSVRIYSAREERDLSHDWSFQEKLLMEFSMSEAQWAYFVSSFGNGGGTHVTLRHYAEGSLLDIPQPPAPKPVLDKFSAEIKGKTDIVEATLKEARELVAQLRAKPSVKKSDLDELSKKIATAEREVIDNMPYVETCFNERMEQVVTEAQIEFEGYVNSRIQEMGLQAIAAGVPMLTKGEAA